MAAVDNAKAAELTSTKEKSPRSSDIKTKFNKDVDPKIWWTVFTLIVIATAATRFYQLNEPAHVCWDEAHFGKFAGYYINRTFFFDVHPPLGKMLIGLFGYLDGYQGNFAFETPGDMYGDIPYQGMRLGCAILGAFLVPLSFLTVWEMTFSLPAATFAGLLILLDTGFITLNRYILLDPPLLFFISASVYTVVKFHNQRHWPFSFTWWFWLSTNGLMLAAAVSVKFVGLFVVCFVGFRVIADLWDILGDLSRPVSYTVQHFIARALCLIVLPIMTYVAIFYVHLSVLSLTGPGDAFFSSRFQLGLEGNMLHNASTPKDVAYGASLRLRNNIVAGGFLHSHKHLYPEGVGVKQQQVTTYQDEDNNNLWIVKKFDQPAPEWNSTDPVEFVRNGDLIRLEHQPTRRLLHSLRVPAVMSRRHFLVTGYGVNGTGNDNDVWRVVIENGAENEVLETMRHRFRLVHHIQKCVLSTTEQSLPSWGYNKQEVTCNPNNRANSAFWSIEDNIYPRLPNVSFDAYKLSFFERFIESHLVIFGVNAILKPKDDHSSRPWMWPINLKGQFFCSTVEHKKVYLLGNPIIWWGNLVLMTIYFGIVVLKTVQSKRGILPSARQFGLDERMMHSCGWLYIGWLIHYVPFWSMGRVLYFHHYFPALLFASMLSGVIIDYAVDSLYLQLPKILSHKFYYTSFCLITSGLVYSFVLFKQLSYGMSLASADKSNSTMYGLRWLDSWDF